MDINGDLIQYTNLCDLVIVNLKSFFNIFFQIIFIQTMFFVDPHHLTFCIEYLEKFGIEPK